MQTINGLLEHKVTNEEMDTWIQNMCIQIHEFKPDELVAVSRSGFYYCGRIAQHMNFKFVGYYNPLDDRFSIKPSSQRLVFIDDMIKHGETLRRIDRFIHNYNSSHFPNYARLSYKYAVPFAAYENWDEIKDMKRLLIVGEGEPTPTFKIEVPGCYYGRVPNKRFGV